MLVYQHFLLFPRGFQKPLSLGSLELGTVFYRVNVSPTGHDIDMSKARIIIGLPVYSVM